MKYSISITLFLVLFSIPAFADIEGVTLYKGLSNNSVDGKQFSSLTEAQKYANAKGWNSVTLSLDVVIPNEVCSKNIPAISFGYLYDQDITKLNGQIVGSVGNPLYSGKRLSLIPRVYPLPKEIIKCGGTNQIEISVRRILGGWIGPFAGEINFGELHELQDESRIKEALGPLFQRDIGIIIFAIAVMLFFLFFRYHDNKRQSAFVLFALSASLLCLSLSSWFYRYFDNPGLIFRLHCVIVSVALSTQILFVGSYRKIKFADKVSRTGFLPFVLISFIALVFSINSNKTLLGMYLYILLALISLSLIAYVSPFFLRSQDRIGRLSFPIEIGLFILHFGAISDIARIWKLHSFENISPYTYGLSIFLIGSTFSAGLVEVFQKAQKTAKTEAKLKENELQTQISRQIAHDIRSPLSALKMILSYVSELPESRRLVIRNAVNRINDIANSLLNYNTNSSSNILLKGTNHVVNVSSVLDVIVSEKRIKFRENSQLEICTDFEQGYGLYTNIDTVGFGRVISNLINNSVEASSGKILVKVAQADDCSEIYIVDDGIGISDEHLAKVFDNGFSFNKDGGHGLGLFQASEFMRKYNGDILVESKSGEGTKVKLTLPKVNLPSWHLPSINVSNFKYIVTVDDDEIIHQIWMEKLSNFTHAKFIHVKHQSLKSFKKWLLENTESIKDSLFLIDYEFIGEGQSGIDVIQEFEIYHSSVLVSSRIEEPEIIDRAIGLDLKLLLKSQVELLPLSISKDLRNLYVLIDDCKLTHNVWNISASVEGINLKCYSSFEDFKRDHLSISRQSKVYIDSNLGNDIFGEDLAPRIKKFGFDTIFLATGYSDKAMNTFNDIKGIVGKEAPWL